MMGAPRHTAPAYSFRSGIEQGTVVTPVVRLRSQGGLWGQGDPPDELETW